MPIHFISFAISFLIKRPNGTVATLDGSILNEPGTDGWVRVITTEEDDVFSTEGFYEVQVVLSKAGSNIHSSIFGYDAEDGLDA